MKRIFLLILSFLLLISCNAEKPQTIVKALPKTIVKKTVTKAVVQQAKKTTRIHVHTYTKPVVIVQEEDIFFVPVTPPPSPVIHYHGHIPSSPNRSARTNHGHIGQAPVVAVQRHGQEQNNDLIPEPEPHEHGHIERVQSNDVANVHGHG